MTLEDPYFGHPPTTAATSKDSDSNAAQNKDVNMKGKVSVCIHSFLAKVDISLKDKTVLANGYQSWSTSYAGADEATVLHPPNWFYSEMTKLSLASDSHLFAYSGQRGVVHSNLVTVMRDKVLESRIKDSSNSDSSDSSSRDSEDEKGDKGNWNSASGGASGMRPEEIVLCGSLSEDSGYTYFCMDFNQDSLTISQDCVGRKLQATKGDKLVLNTYFGWGSKETQVWDAYKAAWLSIHKDRRSVPSSQHNQLSGWTSWYTHYQQIDEHIILQNLQHVHGNQTLYPPDRNHQQRQEYHGWPSKVFQIDDGYTAIGDWLDYDREKFPRGLAFIAQSIREKGLVPGLWLSPFIAGRESKLVKDHPNWFVRKPTHLTDHTHAHGDAGGGEEGEGRGGEVNGKEDTWRTKVSRLGLRRLSQGFDRLGSVFSSTSDLILAHPGFSAGAYALDLEHPEVQAHLANVFQVVVQQWGFKMIKLDFLFAAALVARNHKTCGQLMWEAMQMVRTWAGPETILLGCGVPLGSSFMLVDYYSMDTQGMSTEQRTELDLFFPWPTTPGIHTEPHEIIRVLQPIPSQKDVYMIQVQAGRHFNDNDKSKRTEERTLIVVTNLFSKKQTVHLSTLDEIITKEEDMTEDRMNESSLHQKTTSVYFDTSTGNFGSSAAAYTIKPRETIVFLRVLDSFGRLCGPTASLCTSNGRSLHLILKEQQEKKKNKKEELEEERVHLLATMGGHVLPTTEIEAFERDVSHDPHQRFIVKFKPSLFPKTVTLWLAWKKPSINKTDKKGDDADQTTIRRTVNGQPLQLHPKLLLGSGVILASCTLCV
ncbi:hypothetical protein BG011_002342 [Mortierella polycephala]|uniref:alpha-galactosidase n=1 Tax=Mortierella polycephala TaxID=41804 RepID=A0A9P6Q6Z5_9FUNG|nr:hypothetical protein BG011_002342 [Mortierella polycephala]